MSGQQIFAKLKPVTTAIGVVFKLLPRFLFTLTWPLLELVPWKLGIFLRFLWAKRLAKSCGDYVVFETGVRVTFWEHIELGSNVAIYETCYLDAKGGIKIGDNVSIAHQSSLISFDFDIHNFDGPLKFSPMNKKPIIIGDDTMIFSGVRIFAGAKLAPRTVVAANAVVRQGDYQPGVYAGMPAVWKKSL
ncbi:MAG: acyltransferase [Ahrensia sp.]|nr:acyltransferase [Ahrensia sp.]